MPKPESMVSGRVAEKPGQALHIPDGDGHADPNHLCAVVNPLA